MPDLEVALLTVVEGDLSGLRTLLLADHSELLNAATKLPNLSVSRSALTRVLKDWRSGLYADDVVQQWASFVRRGYASADAGGPPIIINYDANDEDLIVEMVGRLDEIVDLIDGKIYDQELDEMLRMLRTQTI